MEAQELKKIWKNSSEKESVSVNTKNLVNSFKAGMEDRERIVRRRDRREIIAAIVSILFFIYAFLEYQYPISRIGSLIGIISLLYLIYKLYNNRKSKFMQELFMPIQDQFKSQKQFMVQQAKLLDTALYWVFIPIFIANSVFVWGVSKSEQPLTILEQLTNKWDAKLIITLIFAGIFGYLGWMNKKAAKVNWKPLINQIDTILDDLKKE